MAVTGLDKVFVVNENTNTKYGGVDPTGSFQTVNDLKGYKVYTALLTQKGGDDIETIGSGELTIGVSYRLHHTQAGSDFRNVGGPLIITQDDFEGKYFVATGTIPDNWNGTELIYNTGAPVVTVLENTIGNVWFTYEDTGYYKVNSNGLFINNKTIVSNIATCIISAGYNNQIYTTLPDSSAINIYTSQGANISESSNYQLSNTPIEIRVYN